MPQCESKPSGSETIDDRIDTAGYEHAGAYYVTIPSDFSGIGPSPDSDADRRDVAPKECKDNNNYYFGCLDILLQSGRSVKSRQVQSSSLEMNKTILNIDRM